MAINSYQHNLEQQTVSVTIGDRTINLNFDPIDTDIPIDDILKIQYDNLWGEALTIAVLTNKIGLLRAQIRNSIKAMEHEFEILCAQVRQQLRQTLRANGVAQTYLEKAVSDALVTDTGVSLMQKTLIRMNTELEYVESLYWSAKVKADQLANLTKNLVPGDLERSLVERQVNFALVKSTSNINSQFIQ